eukprot:jgi/Antlo1/1188/1093
MKILHLRRKQAADFGKANKQVSLKKHPMLQSNIVRDFFFDNIYTVIIVSSLIVCTAFSFVMTRSYVFRLCSKRERESSKKNDIKKSVDKVFKRRHNKKNK